MKDSYLDTPLQAKRIEFGIWIVVLLRKFMMLNLMKTKGSQVENENLEDVRGIQLSNAMNNMDVGELRPRQVNDDEHDQVQVLSNSNVQDNINQVSTSGSHENEQDQVASTSSQPNDQASAGSDRGDYEGFLTFPQRRAKRYSSGLLMACVILILCLLCSTLLRV